MKNKALPNNLNFVKIDIFARPTFRGELIWDGTYHGDTDPVGPIGPYNPDRDGDL